MKAIVRSSIRSSSKCYGSKDFIMSCGTGTVFNPNKQNCDWLTMFQDVNCVAKMIRIYKFKLKKLRNEIVKQNV